MAIEKKFVREQINRLRIKKYLHKETERAGFGGLEIQRTPMGTRVSLTVERPGMVIGRRGATIQKLTSDLAQDFDAENPQIEVIEAGRNANLNANIMAAKVAEALERGWHFRRAGHSTVRRIMESGAKGCIVILSGKLTGQRHRIEKFISGHIKYNGDTAIQLMDVGYSQCKKKLGTIGCTVKIMGPDARLPDEVTVYAPGEKDAPPAPAPTAAKPTASEAAAKTEASTETTEAPPAEERPRRPRRREPMPMPTEADLAEAKALAAAKEEAKAEAKAEAAAKADKKPAATPEAKPAAKADAKPEAKPEAKAEVKADAKPEVKAEANPEVKAEAKPEAKAEVKADAKPEVKAEAKPEAKAEVKADAKPEVKAEAKPEAKPEVKADAKPEAKPAAKIEEKSEAKADKKPQEKSEEKPAAADAPKDETKEAN